MKKSGIISVLRWLAVLPAYLVIPHLIYLLGDLFHYIVQNSAGDGRWMPVKGAAPSVFMMDVLARCICLYAAALIAPKSRAAVFHALFALWFVPATGLAVWETYPDGWASLLAIGMLLAQAACVQCFWFFYARNEVG